ncbi:MAG: ATP-binding protein [Pseudomonadota bacterium]
MKIAATTRLPDTIRSMLGGAAVCAVSAGEAAAAQIGATGVDPVAASAVGAVSLAVASVAYAVRSRLAARGRAGRLSDMLAEMEARVEKADAVLATHPGLVVVWEDETDDRPGDDTQNWGAPRIFGGAAALASLMSFAAGGEGDTPAARLLNALGDLPVDEDAGAGEPKSLHKKIEDLRRHGIAFSGSVMTSEGRGIEASGRLAGGQTALWLTDPAARKPETGALGRILERSGDLHGALSCLERAPTPAWRRNAPLDLVWVNKAYAKAVEAPSPSAAVSGQIELDPSLRARAQAAAADKKAVEAAVSVNIEGDRRALRVFETPLHGAGAAAIGGFAIDVTEIERAKSDLARHIEAHRRTLDDVPTAVALFGPNRALAYHNAAFAKLWRVDEADLVGGPTHDELLDSLRHAGRLPEQADYAAWKRRQIHLYTEDHSAPGSERDGGAPDEVWHLPDGRTLRVAQSRHPFGGVLTVFDDITQEVSLERRFNTQISVQKATLNTLAEGVAVFQADGTLRLYNDALQKMWRLETSLLKDAPHVEQVLQALAPQTRGADDTLTDIKRRATSMSPEARQPVADVAVDLADGRTFSFGADPLPDGATLIHFLDVTDSREREKELKECNALLEEIDRQKSKFVDHVSYQLRTPLATIIGFAEMLDDQMFGMLNDRQHDYVASILSASHHLRDLISDIIDLAAIDAGKLGVDMKEVDIRELLESAATYAALKAEDTQVHLAVSCPPDVGTILADEKRLKQVLFNLLSNAFAYTDVGGAVTLGADRAPGLVRLWVDDSGRGVSADDQPQAFEPFVSRGPSAGAGIGLALVKRFVDLHNGWVRMESAPNDGTRVTCYLPSRRSAPTADADGAVKESADARADATASTGATGGGAAGGGAAGGGAAPGEAGKTAVGA